MKKVYICFSGYLMYDPVLTKVFKKEKRAIAFCNEKRAIKNVRAYFVEKEVE